jgi:hypothetical protein
MVGAKQETTFSVERNDGPPTRTNSIREKWRGDRVSAEYWCTTILHVSSLSLLSCAMHDLPSPLRRFAMAVDSKGSDSLFWVFRCGVEPVCGPHCESRPSGLSLKVFIEKFPVETNDDYISIPANHERLQLETDYGGEAEFTFTHIFLID